MFRRSTAASADELHPRRHKFPRVACHVFRRTKIDVAALNRPRHAGVRLRRQRQGSHRPHPLDGVEHRHRSHAAVDAKHIDFPFRQARGEGLGIGSIQAIAVFVNRDLGDDGNLRVYVAAGQHRLMHLFEIAEGLKHQQIDAPFHQGLDLFAKGRACLFKRRLAQRFDAHPERPNRSRDPDVETLGRLSSHVRARHIDVPHAIGQTMPRQVLVSIISAPACR